MNHLNAKRCLTLSALALLGLMLPGRATAQSLKPFKATLTGPLTNRFVIPVEPQIRLGAFTAGGQATLLGAVKYVEANTLHMSVQGHALSVTDGVAVLTAANGDALFVTYSGPTTSNTSAEFTFTVCGGRGAFLGATGSGVIHYTIQSEEQTITRVFEGAVGVPTRHEAS